MWQATLLIFLITVVISAIVGDRARVRFILLLRDHHPLLYDKLGQPSTGANTSLFQGIKMQGLVFSKTPELSPETERARRYLRRVTIVIIGALILETILMIWAFGQLAA